jgi:alkylation response protein AidB-like acyl-CoA dehydrogenase
VNFDYTDDQKALKHEARRFLADVCPLSVARGVLDDPTRGHDADLWVRIGEQGWCGAAIPEAYGGLGLGYVELCALSEELGRAVAPVPFASSVYLFAEALLTAGTEAQKSEWLPQVARGALIGTVASNEGPGMMTGEHLATTYANGALTGVKLPVTDGMAADFAVVLAHAGDAPGLFLVDLTGPGVTREWVSTIDPTRGAAKLVFDAAPAEPLSPGNGLGQLSCILDRAAILLAFEALGGADRALEMARDYALERYAFGRPIGSYQAIKHKLADVFVRNEVARANAYYGAWALASDAPELGVASAAARISSSAAYYLAARENIQTHGGIGFTWEADCHFFYRRARHLSLILGAPRMWKRKLTDRLVARFESEVGA